MKDFKFVSYSGKYPTLCIGELVVEINGQEKNLGNCLISTGSCEFNEMTFECEIVSSPWKIDENSPSIDNESFTKEDLKNLTSLVNKNIQHGCCGGCCA